MTAYRSIEEVPLFRYGLIMADPPWSFDNYSPAGEAKNAKAQYEGVPRCPTPLKNSAVS